MKFQTIVVKLIFIIFIMNVCYTNAYSNIFEKVDIELIKNEIVNENSKYFYPKLYERYSTFDTTLTIEDYRYLYYGHSLQPYFDPNITRTHDSVIALRKYLFLPEIEYQRVIDLAGFVLRLDPFYIDGIYIIGLSYEKLNDSENAAKWLDRYYKIIRAIWGSGNGKTPESAFKVLSVSDEFAVIEALTLEYSEQSLTQISGKFYDVITVKENELGVKEIYFDIDLFNDKIIKK